MLTSDHPRCIAVAWSVATRRQIASLWSAGKFESRRSFRHAIVAAMCGRSKRRRPHDRHPLILNPAPMMPGSTPANPAAKALLAQNLDGDLQISGVSRAVNSVKEPRWRVYRASQSALRIVRF